MKTKRTIICYFYEVEIVRSNSQDARAFTQHGKRKETHKRRLESKQNKNYILLALSKLIKDKWYS